jgi:site-specific recombinase XerD
VILCEALLDALTCWVLGFRTVTAAYGVEGYTADHLEAFTRYGVERVLIAYDRDPAGDRAAVQLAVRLVAAGIDCFRIQLPQGEDVNSFVVQDLGTAQSRLARAIRKATWLRKGNRPQITPTSEPVSAAVEIEPGPAATKVEDQVRDETLFFAAEPLAPVEASPLPPAPPADDLADVGEAEVTIQLSDRRWRVRGLARNTSFDILRVNLLVSREGGAFHLDTLELYSARARQLFTKQAADELGVDEEVIKRDVGKVLLRLEAIAAEEIRRAQEPVHKPPSLSAEEEAEALALLRDPRLLERIVSDFDRIGVVGEETNKLVGYLAATSRKGERPLAVIVQSATAAGKSSLLEAILSLMPEEERVKYSATTGQSLFYVGEHDLAHKILAVVEEEGAERAAYALKLLQSEGELSIASTGKDAATGRLVTHEYKVKGPVAILLTTTAVDFDEELLNRCIVLSVDEERAQTQAIHARQRESETLEGLLAAADRERLIRVHRNAQRLLRPVLVANPYARQLRFSDEQTRSRRDHTKYLALIRTIALLHQHQRPVRTTVHGGREVAYRGGPRRHRGGQLPGPRGAGALPRRAAAGDATPAARPRRAGRSGVRALSPGASRRAFLTPATAPVVGPGGHPAQGAPGPAGGARVPGRAPSRPRPQLRLRAELGRRGQRRPMCAQRPGRPRSAEHRGRVRRRSVGVKGAAVGVRSAPGRPSVGRWSGCGQRTERQRPPAQSPRCGRQRCCTHVCGHRARCNRSHRLRLLSCRVTSGCRGGVVTSRRDRRRPLPLVGDRADPNGMGHAIVEHLPWLRQRQYAERTVEKRADDLARFCAWCEERSVLRPSEVTRAVLDRYRHHLFCRRGRRGQPLSARTQYGHLHTLRMFFRWATRDSRILFNPAAELEMPRLPWQLPRGVLSAAEAELILARPNLLDPLGVRDRAILEVLYSTAIRRTELCGVSVWDIDRDRGTLVRQGKGRRDRVVPIGERALVWVDKYAADVRPLLAHDPSEDSLFLDRHGQRLAPGQLTHVVRRHLLASGVEKEGGCHLFRHTCATLMLEGGADIRFIQEMLGHASLSVTHIYTRVSVDSLKRVHTATHPAATNARHRSP